MFVRLALWRFAYGDANSWELAVRAHAARVVAGEVLRGGLRIRTDAGSQTIGIGDHIETRHNDRRVTYGPGTDAWVRNHDRWQVRAIDQRRGTLDVEHLRHHARLTLPADYVQRHVRLGYTSTIASAQGLPGDVRERAVHRAQPRPARQPRLRHLRIT
jgi:hypothetical protein